MFHEASYLMAAPDPPSQELYSWAAVPFTISINQMGQADCKSQLSHQAEKTFSPWNFNTGTVFYRRPSILIRKPLKTGAE